jgi:protein CpxP
MKKLAAGCFSLFLATISFSQTETEKVNKEKLTPEQRTEKYVTVMQRETGIDETQKQKVYELRLEKMKAVKKIREDHKGDKEAIKTEAKPVVKEYNTKLKEILNSTQLEKWKAYRKGERERVKAAIEKRKNSKNEKAKENPLEDDDFMDSLEDDE